MNFILTILKTNMVTTQDYYLLTLIIWCLKFKLYKIKGAYEDFSKDKNMFDFSNYLFKPKTLWWFKTS